MLGVIEETELRIVRRWRMHHLLIFSSFAIYSSIFFGIILFGRFLQASYI